MFVLLITSIIAHLTAHHTGIYVLLMTADMWKTIMDCRHRNFYTWAGNIQGLISKWRLEMDIRWE